MSDPITETPPQIPPPAVPPVISPDPTEIEALRKLNADQARALVLAQARLDFPKADGELLSQFQGTPEALRSFAEKLHAHELARTPAPSPVTPAAPTPGPGNASTPEDLAAARYNELRTKTLVHRNAEPWERDEFSQMAFAKGWNAHQADRKLGRSSGG